MHSPERDIQHIRLVGGFVFGIGMIQLLLTFLALLWGLFGGVSTTPTFAKGILAVALSLVMASIMTSCAVQLQRLRHFTSSQIQNIRLVWTALVMVMVTGGIIALWVVPPLTTLSVLVLLALFTARRPIIRLSSN